MSKTGFNYEEISSFFENMGMMVRAGISVNEAVGLLREETEPEDRVMTAALTCMTEKLSEGSTLEEAMRAAGSFPDYAADMVRAAEYTGKLEDTLFHLSGYYRSEDTMRKIEREVYLNVLDTLWMQHLENMSKVREMGHVICAGGLLDDDGKMKGSFLIMEFDSRKQLDDYLETEPYMKSNVWQDVRVETCNVVIRNPG